MKGDLVFLLNCIQDVDFEGRRCAYKLSDCLLHLTYNTPIILFVYLKENIFTVLASKKTSLLIDGMN